MFRLIFVILIIAIGAGFALRRPFYGLLFYLWNAYFRPESWVYGGSILALNLSFFIGLYVVVRTLATFPNPRISTRTVLLWLFLAQACIGAYFSEHRDFSVMFLRDFSKVMLITYMIILLVNDRKEFRLALLVIALSLGFETAKQGWANLVRAPGAQNNNPIPFLGDNNGVALGTMMLLPVLGALAQTATSWWQKNVWRFVAVGVFLRGISTYSRGGFLGAAALGAVAVLRGERKLRSLAALVVLALTVWMLMPPEYFARLDTITVAEGEEREESSAGRLHFWQVAVEMAKAKPFTGVGLAGFTLAYPDYNTDQRFGGERAAHSVWFAVLADLGYPGLILLLANLGMACVSCWRVVVMSRQHEDMKELRIYANGLISLFVVYSTCGSFLSHQYSEMAWHFYGLATALYLIALKESASRRNAGEALAA